MISPGSPEAALAFAVRAAMRDIALPRFRTLGRADISLKSDALDPVTEVDLEIESRLTEVCRDLWPGAAILGEEAAAADPDLERQAAAADLAVVIDPLDGTWNFAAGTPVFGTIVAVVRAGRPIVGLIHDGPGDRCLVAVRGGGVCQRQGDGAWHHLRPPAPPTTALREVAACLPTQPSRTLPRVARVMASGASCHDYQRLVQGDLHLNLAAAPRPWDHLAGSLIVEEAGGRAAWIDGRPYRLGTRGDFVLSALDAPLWDRFAAAFHDTGQATVR